jgi:hypothetical protein
MAKGQPSKPKVPPRGKGAEGSKASTHKHNDNGKQRQEGKTLVTHCTCGAPVAWDFNPGDA